MCFNNQSEHQNSAMFHIIKVEHIHIDSKY